MKAFTMSVAILGLTAVSFCQGFTQESVEHPPSTLDPTVAIERLKNGNRRFVAGRPTSTAGQTARRQQIAAKQRPFAVIVCCSDSRIPPELVFDQGLGDLFVVRLAGNIVDDAAMGSVEYGVGQLGARLIVVLGHQRCGAVEAALGLARAEGHMLSVLEAIRPAIESSRGLPGNALDNAIKANIRLVERKVRTSRPVIAPLVLERKVRVVSAYYELDSGKIQVLP